MVVTSVRGRSPRLSAVLGRALTRPTPLRGHPTDDRIIDATLAALAVSGLAKLAVEDVARRAGVTRMTVYRRFRDRQHLIEATMARESARLLAAVAAADDPRADPVERIVRIVTTSLGTARRHPLVAHWLATDPGELLRAVLADDAAVLRAGAAYVAATIRGASGSGARRSRKDTGPDPERTGDLLVRLYGALVLMPPPSVDLDDPRQVESLARDLIAPILVGSHSSEGRPHRADVNAISGSSFLVSSRSRRSAAKERYDENPADQARPGEPPDDLPRLPRTSCRGPHPRHVGERRRRR